MNGVLAGMIIYLLILISIGAWAKKYTRTEAEYFIGGRKVHVLAATLSDKASDFSGWLMLGYPGQAFKAGLGAFWAGIGCFFGTLADYILIGPRLRIYAGKFRAITVPDFLEARLRDNTKLIRLIGAIIILIFMTAYVSAQFTAGGKALSEIFGIDVPTGIIITTLIVLTYVLIGGFFAVVWTDVIQALFMISSLVLLAVVAILALGNLENAVNVIESIDPSKVHPFGGAIGLSAVIFAIGYASWIVGYLGQPHIITRYMSVEDPRKLRRPGIFISGIWTAVVLICAFLAGFVGFALAQKGLISVDDPEKVIPAIAVAFMPSWLAGFITAGILAAIMSTADSQLLVASSAISRDLIHKIIGIELSQRWMVNIGRVFVLILSLIACYYALNSSKLVYAMVVTAWGGLAVGFGPIVTLSLWWKRVTKWGGIIGMAYGLISEVILEAVIYGWEFNPNAPGIFGSIGAILNGVPVFFVNFFVTMVVIVLVSLVTKPPSDIVELHEKLFIKVAREKSQAEHVSEFLSKK
ncbi:sodium/proline symporter [Archaeoglobus profundus]|uniref:SSS sodium solute transporter superfamily n=1 Tax=Archaeoglobus profundus (strain DSM 5631 / JCM 9629 / NBRC 100127 / Av18) TaxID=572546 RepID=D2RFE8_ARCPA|nr:sodium/proline symporter [Archaeoglobus profundus]ADB58842.1 SSS sodium solute transporter superfamily [Archaeoglobus profundus DSM 5631]